MTAASAASSAGGLHCLGGTHGPPELAAHLQLLATFDRDAREQIWTVLGPSLAEPIDPASGDAARAFCARHGVPPEHLSRVVKACRFLLRAAARIGLSAEAFDADVAMLATPGRTHDEDGDATVHADAETSALVIREVLRAGFAPAMSSLRREILVGSLADHGRVLVKMDWRLDRLLASERGDLGVDVTVLTLHVQEGPARERITLQLLPDDLRALRDLCNRLLP